MLGQMSLQDNIAELIGKNSFNPHPPPPALYEFPHGLKQVGRKEQSYVCASCKARGNGSSLPWHLERTEPGRAWSLLLLSCWVGSRLFDLSRSEGIFQVREAEPGVSADRLKKQMPGKHRQRGRTRHSAPSKRKTSLSQTPSPPTPLPTCSQLASADQTLALPSSPFPGVTAELPAHPSLLQLPVAGNILKPLPNCTAVCLSAAAGASLPKNTSAHLPAM